MNSGPGRLSLFFLPAARRPKCYLNHDAARVENRFNMRFQTGCRFRISWRDKRGKTKSKNVKVLDMSGDGALI